MIRTRFAPSPTGYLHVGGARTALFSWLYARSLSGECVLRIEDTDRARSTQASVDAIFAGLSWLGLDFDGPTYYQTQRFDRYRAVIDQLLLSGHAYRCTCSVERLEQLRAEQMAAKRKPRYDGRCRDLNAAADAQPFVVRFRNPLAGQVQFDDLVRGSIVTDNCELDDLVIARTDGTPTYNLTVVVDDWDMGITHVIRGDDHINNTPRQLNILNALGAKLPQYAHLPMILGGDGQRLSKRHGAVSVMAYEQLGILPEAMINYLAKLGWSKGDQELFSMDELIAEFSLSAVNRAPASFDVNKLLWLNQHYLRSLSPLILAPAFKSRLEAAGHVVPNEFPLDRLLKVQTERYKTWSEIVDHSAYFFAGSITYTPEAAQKHLTAAIAAPLAQVQAALAALGDWRLEVIDQIIMAVVAEYQLKLGQLAQPIRVALTGETSSPAVDLTIFLIGQATVCNRLASALSWIGHSAADR